MSKPAVPGRKKRDRWAKRDTELTVLTLPTVIWYICFCYFPMFGILMAFKNFKIVDATKNFFYNLLQSEWNGVDNFKFLFTSGSGALVVKLTLLYNIVFIILGVVVPVCLSLMMSQLYSKRFGKVCQTFMFLPYFMSWVVVTYFVFAFLSPDKGLANSILTSMGKDPVSWYQEPKYWPAMLIFLSQWKGMGYGMVVYLASITGIDGTLYEAAMIDGAGRWKRMWYITLPGIKGTAVTLLIMNLGKVMNSNLERLQAFANSQVRDFEYQLAVYIYEKGLNSGQFSKATAVGLFQSLVGLFLVLASDRVAKALGEDGLL